MNNYAGFSIPPPTNWEVFEDICCAAAKIRFKNQFFTKNGRTGQKQNGVDIFGQDKEGNLIAIQCKVKINKPREKDI